MVDPVKRRRYTATQKARAVGIAVVKGQRPASEETGIPLSTLHHWFESPDMAQLRTTAREEVTDQMWVGVQVGIAEMVKGLRDERTPLRDKTDATSMLAEKFLLLTGQATSRAETRELLADFDDHEREAMTQWLHDMAREKAAADAGK